MNNVTQEKSSILVSNQGSINSKVGDTNSKGSNSVAIITQSNNKITIRNLVHALVGNMYGEVNSYDEIIKNMYKKEKNWKNLLSR